MELAFMIIGFMLASYSVVGNDVIQTLGTFLSSNKTRPWWVLWLYTTSILIAVLVYGWITYEGDVSYGRLETIGDLPNPFYWWYIIPPLVLLVITHYGIPVSTTFLILSVFKVQALPKMVVKSLIGYGLAFVVAIMVYFLISNTVEKYFIKSEHKNQHLRFWTVAQWLSTGFLWAQWLVQDLANIYVYLPRKLDTTTFLLTLILISGLQALIFYFRGGRIQQIVTTKVNTEDIRSATIIDFIYGIILLVFAQWSKIPM
ncbi:MAG: hypothetical protein NZ521_04490, partial [Flammeovirgaceae bacterium]|nr:hypothetical protein [Flammeovirgaceae bacterium]MDW8287466.1 hypothetical protein [Flammeovirgaceae bacterium]